MAPRLQELYPAHWDQPKCLTGRAPENSATFGDYCPVPGRDGLLPPHQGMYYEISLPPGISAAGSGNFVKSPFRDGSLRFQ